MTVLAVDLQAVDDQASLIAAAANGDKGAFAQLYERYAQKVYNLVLRSVRHPQAAEDVSQEVWTRVYRELPTLRESAAFPTWLYRTASRACIDSARKRARRPEAALDEAMAMASEGDPEEAVIRSERAQLAWEALAALPVRQHLSLYLREMEGKNYQEIASILDTSESAVETLLFRARRGLAAAYERFEDAMPDRCGQARKSMAVLADGEATLVQRRAVESHVDSCRPCRSQLVALRRASAVYGFVPLLPVPALPAERVLEGLGIGATGVAGASGLTKILGLMTTSVKSLAATATLTGGLAVATIVSPVDTPIAGRAAGHDVPAAAVPAAAAPTGAGDPVQDAADASIPQPADDSGDALGDALDGLPDSTAPLPGPVLDALNDGGVDMPATPSLPLHALPVEPPTLPVEPPTSPLALPTAPEVLAAEPIVMPTLPNTLPTLPITIPTPPISPPSLPGLGG